MVNIDYYISEANEAICGNIEKYVEKVDALEIKNILSQLRNFIEAIIAKEAFGGKHKMEYVDIQESLKYLRSNPNKK